MKKGGFLRNVLDTIRSNQANQSAGSSSASGNDANVRQFGGQLKAQHFSVGPVARHGFPESPTALAFDPVQKIAAIGTKTGALRVFGRPGVDVWAQHKPEFAVTHIRFVINQGAIITVTADESIHLWSLRGPQLRLQHSQQSAAASPLPAQAASPAPPSSSASQQPQSAGGNQSGGAAAHTAAASHRHSDSGAQPGDPDYLADQLSSSSPTYDKSKQYPRQPEILHTLKFQREHITCLHQTLMSKWLYIGTERGNVHVANVETFELSGYSIAWNKAIELCRKTHPGSIIHISECPQDTNKLLIGYESGCIVLWDLKGKTAEGRYYHTENLLWLAWHYEGKQFVAAHGDGSLVTWQTRSNARPVNILYPHAKTPTAQAAAAAAAATADQGAEFHQFQQQQQQQQSFVARALNNELYRPINKVDWKISKSSEQFLLFSGGLPYDGLEGQPSSASPLFQQQQQQQQQHAQARAASVQPASQQPQQFLKASSVSHNPSPTSPSISPMNPLAQSASSSSNNGDPAARPAKQQPSQMGAAAAAATTAAAAGQKERKSLRSTSLTVMYGRSITVLEMDETIIDFITICDNSPYENDTSDPLAVIILLSNDLILIDLTSAGYPSFDSPYPSANLNESPVTCVQYLAHCSSDLIPFLYSTSQNVVSRAPKKGFSDKEWPINGGEWGQQMQSYPELVLTGHADGTIKFWDMSGVNFDLISKIKTAKFFERPNKLRNSTIIAHSQALALSRAAAAAAAAAASARPSRPIGAAAAAAANSAAATTTAAIDQLAAGQSQDLEGQHQQAAAAEFTDENPFAIERIEYYPASKNLVIAGALAQVIQFRVNKREAQLSPASAEIATILVEPTQSDSINQPMGPPMQPQQQQQQQQQQSPQQQQQQPQKQQHSVLKVRNPLASGAAAGSSSGGSSCSSSGSSRARSSGFQAELICLTPSLLVPSGADFSPAAAAGAAAGSVARHYYCVAPPKVTALALQAAHNILAYAHENGIVLVDIIQKCVIMSANLSDLYGGASMMQSNRDISIQPFATSSILQHHYQASAAAAAAAAVGSPPRSGGLAFCGPPANNSAGLAGLAPDNGAASRGESDQQQTATDNGENGPPSGSNSNNNGPDLHKSALRSSNEPTGSNQPKSRFTANSAFQRQLSTTALQTAAAAAAAASDGSPARSSHASPGGVASGPRLFQRQMTASQLFNHSSSMSAGGGPAQASGDQAGLSNKQRAAALLASARAGGNSELGGSSFCLSGAGQTVSTTAAAGATTQRPAGSGAGLALGSGFRPSTAGDGSDGAKKAGKKRIISRMLSISAIHTTATSGGGGGGGGGSSTATADQAIGSNGSLANSATLLHNGTTNPNASATNGASASTTTMTNACDQVSDKIDSSFTRSRSSSTSSLTPAFDGQQQLSGESVLCLCFLDWSQAMAASAAASAANASGGAAAAASPAAGSNSGSSSSSSSASAAGTGQGGSGGGGGPAGGHQAAGAASPSSASAGNKSLGSPVVADNSAGQLALWLGTSHGSVLLVHLQMPDSEDNRVLQLQSVNAEPIPQASIKLPGSILCLASFTSELQLAASNAPPGGQSSSPMAAGAASQSSSVESDSVLVVGSAGATGQQQQQQHHHHHHHPAGSNTSAQSSFDSRSSMFLAIVSEKQAKVYQIPSQAKASQQQQQQQQHHNHRHHETGKPAAAAASSASQVESSALGKLLTNKANCISKLDISDSSFACRSALVQMRQPDESCLVSYLATGNIMVHSLPQLRPLLDADFVPYSNQRIGSSMCFSRNGHCLFQPSPSEISKFTISAQYRALVNEMTGLLHVPRDMPEMPRANFFKSLFSVTSSAASKQSDRDELFGECSAGKPTRGVAKHFSSTAAAGASGLEKLKGAAAGTMGHDLRVAREGLDERGEKLSEMEDKTLQMMNQSESYAQAAHQLAQKFKDKKWYQF